jgi:hypothetical protein
MGMFLYAFEDRNVYAFFIAFDSTDMESPFSYFNVEKKRLWMRRWSSSKKGSYSYLG